MGTLSVLGLYHWNDTILDPLTNNIPALINANNLKGELLAQCAELEVLYADPAIFKEILGFWVAGQKPVWDRIATAISAEYNITENYDRSETWTDTSENEKHNTQSGSIGNNASLRKTGTIAKSGTVAKSETESEDTEGSTTSSDKFKAYPTTSGLVEQKQTVVDSESGRDVTKSGTDTTNLTDTYNTTDTDTSTQTISNSDSETNDTSSTHTGRVHGNIGVRSAQELVEQEFALAEKINLQNRIIHDFKERFCLLVY